MIVDDGREDVRRAEWDRFWDDPDRFRWSAVDQEVLVQVARALGWGPSRTLVEIGGGRGMHSKRLWQMGRCSTAHIYDTCPTSRLVAGRYGMPVVEQMRDADIVWSYGLIEHFTGSERQDIIDLHFKYATEQVVIVVPAATWTQRLARLHADTPARDEYTEAELSWKMCEALEKHKNDASNWSLDVHSFAPLFGLRHIPDSMYPLLNPIARKLLPGNLIIGNARRRT